MVSKLSLCVTPENVHGANARRTEIHIAQSRPRSASPLADVPIGDSAQGGSVGRASERVAAESEFDPGRRMEGDPKTKLAKATAAAESIDQMHKFEALVPRTTYRKGAN